MWFIYCLLSAIAIGMSGLLYKYKFNIRAKDIVLVSCMSNIILAMMSMCYLYMKGGVSTETIYKYLDWPLFTALAVAYVGISMFDYSLIIGPSATLHTALYTGAKIVFVMGVSCLFFKENLTKIQMLALGIILLGVGLLAI